MKPSSPKRAFLHIQKNPWNTCALLSPTEKSCEGLILQVLMLPFVPIKMRCASCILIQMTLPSSTRSYGYTFPIQVIYEECIPLQNGLWLPYRKPGDVCWSYRHDRFVSVHKCSTMLGRAKKIFWRLFRHLDALWSAYHQPKRLSVALILAK